MRVSISRYAAAVIGAGVFALTMAPAQAQTTSLAYWSFNDVPSTTDINQAGRDALFSADGGVNDSTAYMTTNFNFIDAVAGSAGVTTFAGSPVNATLPSGTTLSSGQALALQGGTGGGGAVTNNGRYLEFGVSTVGYEDLVISFATRGTSTGFNANQFQYSLDGTNFIDFGAEYNGRPTTFFQQEYDLSGIAGLENNANAAFRIVFDGASGAVGNNRVDNLQINAQPGAAAVPEAGTVALMGMGALPLLGIVARRKRSAA